MLHGIPDAARSGTRTEHAVDRPAVQTDSAYALPDDDAGFPASSVADTV